MEIPEKIEVHGGVEVILTWEDGGSTLVDARQLRAACPCASCREPGGMQATALVLGGGEPIGITEANLVGNYAMSFVFDPDRHGTGIFPFELLRKLGEAQR